MTNFKKLTSKHVETKLSAHWDLTEQLMEQPLKGRLSAAHKAERDAKELDEREKSEVALHQNNFLMEQQRQNERRAQASGPL